jgi:hypothetical protein
MTHGDTSVVQRELGEDPPLFKRHTIPHIWQHKDKRRWASDLMIIMSLRLLEEGTIF